MIPKLSPYGKKVFTGVGILLAIAIAVYVFFPKSSDDIPTVPEKGPSVDFQKRSDSLAAIIATYEGTIEVIEKRLNESLKRERQTAFRLRALALNPASNINVDSIIEADGMSEWLTKLSNEKLNINETADIPRLSD